MLEHPRPLTRPEWIWLVLGLFLWVAAVVQFFRGYHGLLYAVGFYYIGWHVRGDHGGYHLDEWNGGLRHAYKRLKWQLTPMAVELAGRTMASARRQSVRTKQKAAALYGRARSVMSRNLQKISTIRGGRDGVA